MPMNSSFGVRARDEVDAGRQREDQQHEVDDLLGRAEADRAPGDDFLELAEGDVRAPEGDRADDRGEHREDRDVRGHGAGVDDRVRWSSRHCEATVRLRRS
jgi:hypothetical protein